MKTYEVKRWDCNGTTMTSTVEARNEEEVRQMIDDGEFGGSDYGYGEPEVTCLTLTKAEQKEDAVEKLREAVDACLEAGYSLKGVKMFLNRIVQKHRARLVQRVQES